VSGKKKEARRHGATKSGKGWGGAKKLKKRKRKRTRKQIKEGESSHYTAAGGLKGLISGGKPPEKRTYYNGRSGRLRA